MNFKWCFVLLLVVLGNACGVKSDPVPYSRRLLPSIIEEYTRTPPVPLSGQETPEEEQE